MTRNQIAYWELVERERNNLATEAEIHRANLAREAETKRSNLARERETFRSNLARETETKRSNLAAEHLRDLERRQQFTLTTRSQNETERSNRAREQLQAAQLVQNQKYQSAEIAVSQQRNAISAMESRIHQGQLDNARRQTELLDLREGQKIKETSRANMASESIRTQQLYETKRANMASESAKRVDQQLVKERNLETIRSNQRREIETHRHNSMMEATEWVKVATPLIAANSDSIKSLGFKARLTLAQLAVK